MVITTVEATMVGMAMVETMAGVAKGNARNSNLEVTNLPVKCVAKSATLLSIVGKDFRKITVV
jgi:hypothetical protein